MQHKPNAARFPKLSLTWQSACPSTTYTHRLALTVPDTYQTITVTQPSRRPVCSP